MTPSPTLTTPLHFDYRRAATQAALTPDQLQSLIRIFEADYPSDLVHRELHILRACNAINRGVTTITTILSQSKPAAA